MIGLIVILFIIKLCKSDCPVQHITTNNKLPTVGISVLVRNKEHTLPYFLSCLYNLEYPKARIYLW